MRTLDYENPSTGSRAARNDTIGLILALSAIGLSLAGHIVSAVFAADLRHVPRGSAIRPMALVAFLFFVALGTACTGLVLGSISLMYGRRRRSVCVLAALSVLTSLTPLLTSNLVMDYFVRRNGLIWAD
ncbi:MAG: hypothetical protein ABSH20_03940 [Tepidisphaeraceae bacterium]